MHEVEVWMSGSWKREVSLRCCESPMPKRDKRVKQHVLVLEDGEWSGSWQVEVFHGILRT